jgi:ubiquinone/menaquinone biosynthesis C-methylase UbiE
MGTWDESEVASVWLKHAEARNRMMASATERMFERAGVVEGARVLDIGTGTGDTAIFASQRVGASGSVEATDPSAAMVDAANLAIRSAGASNVTVRQVGAEDVGEPPARADAAIGRMVLMFVDLPRALAAIRRALRPGGRFAAVVWSAVERNPYQHTVIEGARAEGPLPDPVPEIIRAFSLHDGDALARVFTAAGFSEVAVEKIPSARPFVSAAEALAVARESPVYAGLFTLLDPAARERAWERIAARYRAFEYNGRCDFPMELQVASGTVL